MERRRFTREFKLEAVRLIEYCDSSKKCGGHSGKRGMKIQTTEAQVGIESCCSTRRTPRCSVRAVLAGSSSPARSGFSYFIFSSTAAVYGNPQRVPVRW